MTKHLKPNPAKLPWHKRTAATLKAKRERCRDCGGVLPEYLCPSCQGEGVGCMECNYKPVRACRCGVKLG